MKFIGFWEFKPEDFDKVIEKSEEAMAEREKGTEKFPKFLFPAHGMGDGWNGFAIYENVTPDQMTNLVLHFMPEMTIQFVPIFETKKATERYLKMKK